MNRTTSKRRTKTSGSSLPNPKNDGILRSTLRGFLVSLAIGAALTLILSVVVYSLADPNRYITPVSFCILYVTSLFGGFFSSRFNRGSALLCGLLNAAMLLAAMLVVSLLFSGKYSADHSPALAVGLRGVAALLSVLGAMIGTHKPPKKRKRK